MDRFEWKAVRDMQLQQRHSNYRYCVGAFNCVGELIECRAVYGSANQLSPADLWEGMLRDYDLDLTVSFFADSNCRIEHMGSIFTREEI